MQTTGPYSLTLGTEIIPTDPTIGVWADQLQVQNYSTFLLTVVAGGATWTISPFMAKTVPLTPLPPTILPGSNPSGAAADKLSLVWLLNGEVSPTPDGALTQPAVDISGTDITVTIDTSGGAVDIQSAPNTSVNSVAPSQVVAPLTTYSGTSYGPANFAIGTNVHAIGLALDDFTLTGDYEDIMFRIIGTQTETLFYQGHPYANRNVQAPGTFLILPCDGALDTSVTVMITSPTTASCRWAMSGFTAALPPYVPSAVPGTVASGGATGGVTTILPAVAGGAARYVVWSATIVSAGVGAIVINGGTYPTGTILVSSGAAASISFPEGIVCTQVGVYDAAGGSVGSVTYSYV